MSWKKLLQTNKVHRHTTSLQEISEFPRVVARDLSDSDIPALSEEVFSLLHEHRESRRAIQSLRRTNNHAAKRVLQVNGCRLGNPGNSVHGAVNRNSAL